MSGTPNNQHPVDTSYLPGERGNDVYASTVQVLGELVLGEDFEDDPLDITVTDPGTNDADWARASDQAHAGTWSFKSGTITDSQQTDADITVPGGSAGFRTWYRVDSEDGFDFFQILVDAVQVFEASGSVDWVQTPILDVAGAATVTLRYIKDFSASSGDDAAWVDDLEFLTATVTPVRRRLTVDGDDRLRVVGDLELDPGYAALDAGAFPIASTAASSLADATYRSWSLTVTAGPVAVNGVTVPTGFAIARSADPGATVDGISWDATGGEVVVDALVEA